MTGMARFSERYGFVEPRTLVQRDELDDETRLEIWNIFALLPSAFADQNAFEHEEFVLETFWVATLKRPRDEAPSSQGMWRFVKQVILQGDFPACMDAIEAILDFFHQVQQPWVPSWEHVLIEAVNRRFERNLVAYRLIDLQLVPIDRQDEMDAVAEAFDAAGPGSTSAQAHLRQAVSLLADREHPDYRNSIKESISAVEAVARSLTGAATLGAAIRALPSTGMETHKALLSAWSSMYGWTSDAGGLRHGDEEITEADQALAKYVLVTSSAFVTLLLDRARSI